MKTPRNWRKMERHPLSAEYPDLPKETQARAAAMLKEHGILNRRKVTIYEGKVLDGWQLLQACIAADVRPDFQPLPPRMTAERYVEIVNDLRRHESPELTELRTRKRQEQVAALRAQGESVRTIAEKAGVSKSQVARDLAEAGASVPSGTVTGKDGRTYHRREPGDTHSEQDARRTERESRNGRVLFDKKAFHKAFGELIRWVDRIGNPYKAHNTPAANGLRRKLSEFRAEAEAWQKELAKKNKE